jgi:ATP-binding cassette subfamily A (ABC1) protein 3
MEMLRKSMGYCPQHDIIFDLLTIKEQIELYAIARGFEKNKETITNEMLHLMNLENCKDLYCNTLSGGMKRRLSLACAFIGNTKIILLDEVIYLCFVFIKINLNIFSHQVDLIHQFVVHYGIGYVQ